MTINCESPKPIDGQLPAITGNMHLCTLLTTSTNIRQKVGMIIREDGSKFFSVKDKESKK